MYSDNWQDERTPVDVFTRQLATRALERSVGAGVDAFVHHGCLTLTGRVDSEVERADAEVAVRSVPGITLVVNHIEVTSEAVCTEDSAGLEDSLPSA